MLFFQWEGSFEFYFCSVVEPIHVRRSSEIWSPRHDNFNKPFCHTLLLSYFSFLSASIYTQNVFLFFLTLSFPSFSLCDILSANDQLMTFHSFLCWYPRKGKLFGEFSVFVIESVCLGCCTHGTVSGQLAQTFLFFTEAFAFIFQVHFRH